MISKIRAKLPRRSAVRQSRYCDHIIALRLQGNSFSKISKWLEVQGEEFYISPVSISENFKKAKREIEIPYAEEVAERWGGDIDFDAAHELKRSILLQRRRIDRLIRAEDDKAKTAPDYFNPKIKYEIRCLAILIKQYQSMMKSPVEAADERLQADNITRVTQDDQNADMQLAQKLEELILKGEIENSDLEEFIG